MIMKKESSLNNRIGSLIIFHATHDGKILISLSAVHFLCPALIVKQTTK